MPSVIKHIERSIRRLTLWTLGRRRTGGRTPDVAALGTAPKILLIRTDRIGDAIVSTPLFAHLRERFPGARIDVVLGTKNQVVAPLLPSIDGVHVLERSLRPMLATLRAVRRARYDVAVNLLANDSASAALFTSLSGARLRIGFRGEAASSYDVAVPLPDRDLHIVELTMLLGEPLGVVPVGIAPRVGVAPQSSATRGSATRGSATRGSTASAAAHMRHADRLRLVIPEQCRAEAGDLTSLMRLKAQGPIVAINISASDREKYWGREAFIDLATQLRLAGVVPAIAAAPRDRDEHAAIATSSGCDILPIAGTYALFAALLERCALVITPDTSIVHLAAALGKPTVMLAPTASVGNNWGPWGVESRVVCGAGTLHSIPAAAVIHAALDLAAAVRPTESTSAAS